MFRILRALPFAIASLFMAIGVAETATAQSCAALPAPSVAIIPGTNAVNVYFDDSGTPSQYYAQAGPAGYTPVSSLTNLGSGIMAANYGSSSPLILTRFTPGPYDFYVARYCYNVNDYSAISPVTTFTIPTCNNSLPWTEGFENMSMVGDTILPSCWYNRGTHATGSASQNTIHDPRTGSNYLVSKNLAGLNTTWTPGFQLDAGVTYDFSSWYAGDGDTGWTAAVLVHTVQADSGAVQLGDAFIKSGDTTNTGYTRMRRSFTPTASGTYYFGVQVSHSGPAAASYLGFDDFAVELCPRMASVTIASNANNVCAGTPVTFTATIAYAQNGPTVQWFKNGVIYPHASMTYTDATLTATDVIQAVLISYDPDLCKSRDTSNAISIAINAPATVAASMTATGVCPRTPVTLTITGTNIGTAPVYGWYKNGSLLPGKTASTLVLDSLPIGAIDAYFGFVRNINTPCATDTFVYTNVVNLRYYPLSASIRPTTTTAICSGSSINLRLNPQDTVMGNSFKWYLNNNLISGATGTTYAATQAGSYTAMVTNPNGCSKTSAAKVLTSIASPEVAIESADGATQICPSGSLGLYPTDYTPGADLRWYRNGISTSTISPSYQATKSGSYTLAATLNGCTTMSDSIVVTLLETPNSNITLNGPAVSCAGTPVFINAVSNPGYTYQWYRSSTAVAGATSAVFAPSVSGTYKVTIQNGPCPTKTSATKTVTINQPPVAEIEITSQTATAASLKGNVGTTLYDYQWHRNGTPIAGATTRYYTATQNGSYTLSLVSKANGCGDTSNVIVVALSSGGVRYAAGGQDEAPVSIYPNPSDGLFHISATEPVNAIVKDIHGRIILDIRNASGIDLTGQAAGIYLLQITRPDGTLLKTEKLIRK